MRAQFSEALQDFRKNSQIDAGSKTLHDLCERLVVVRVQKSAARVSGAEYLNSSD